MSDTGDFPARLRAARQRLGLTQRQACARLGTTQGSWGQLERGLTAVTLEQTARIAAALGLDPSELDPRLAPAKRRKGARRG